MTSIAEADERVRATLDRARDAFRAALRSPGTGGGPSRLLFVGRNLCVDRRRQIVSIPGGPAAWTEGTIDSRQRLGRVLLSLVVGPVRHLDAETFCHIVVAAAKGGPVHGLSETHTALFVNLTVVESVVHPEHELAVWVVAARELAASRTHADLHALLPPLWTAHDPAEFLGSSDRRDPACDPQSATEQRWSAFYVDLARSLVPTSRAALEAASNDVERYAIARSHDDDLWAYVQDNLVEAVAQELDGDPA